MKGELSMTQEFVKWFEDLMAVVDSLGLCKFNYPSFMDIVSTPEVLARGYYAVTGIEQSGEELLLAGNVPVELQDALQNTHRYGNPLGVKVRSARGVRSRPPAHRCARSSRARCVKSPSR